MCFFEGGNESQNEKPILVDNNNNKNKTQNLNVMRKFTCKYRQMNVYEI